MNTMKISFTILIILFTINIGKSQNIELPNYFIKYAPLSILDPISSSLQFSLEQRISNSRSIHYGFGVIPPMGIQNSSEIGYRTRIEYRIYRRGFYPNRYNFFYGPNLILKQTVDERVKNVCITPDCTTTIPTDFVRMGTSAGAAFGFGWNKLTENNWMLELELVQGVVYFFSQDLGLPPLASQPLNPNQFLPFEESAFFNINETFLPTFHFIFRVGFPVE